MITNPEHATKDRLKTELKRAGVPFEGNENKDYYVKLYRSQVMRAKGKGKAYRSEFSSDEEFTSKVKRSPRKQERSVRSPKTAKPDTYMAQVVKLSDQELMEELQHYGENPGPITSTTRSVYNKLLARRMAEKTKESASARKSLVQTEDSYVAEWSSGSEEEDSGEQIPRVSTVRVSTVRVSTPQVSEPRRVSTRSQSRLQASQSKTQSESTFVRERLPHRHEKVEKERVPRPKKARTDDKHSSFIINCILSVVVIAVFCLVCDYLWHTDESWVAQAYQYVVEYVTHSWIYQWIVDYFQQCGEPAAQPPPTEAPPTEAPPTEAPPVQTQSTQAV